MEHCTKKKKLTFLAGGFQGVVLWGFFPPGDISVDFKHPNDTPSSPLVGVLVFGLVVKSLYGRMDGAALDLFCGLVAMKLLFWGGVWWW